MNKKLFILILLIPIIFIFVFYKSMLVKNKQNYEVIDYEKEKQNIKEVYKVNPEIFDFDVNGECKITVEDIHTKQNNYDFEIQHDKYGNMCIGYYILKKDGNEVNVDVSHMCDMINY